MNKAKLTLSILVLMISVFITLVTIYFYGAWQHDRYWNGTIGRVNQIETEVYEKLLRTNIVELYGERDFDRLGDIFAPLNGKLLIRLLDDRGRLVFSNLFGDRRLGEQIRRSEFSLGSTKFIVEFVRYKPPDWNQVFFRWLVHPSEWSKIKYDRITMPFIFFFVIWLLFFVSIIWRYKAHLESDRLFSVLHEFETERNEEKLDDSSPKH